jgi:flagellar biosynthesis/type III secretory pathway protein FliH
LRPAKPWQSTSYLRSTREEQPFSAARWTEAQPQAFADTGMPPRRTDFAADNYEPMTEPLSAEAKKALALLDAEHSHEAFAQEKNASEDGSSTNAHLPFVLDVYKSRSDKTLHVAKPQPVVAPFVADDLSPQAAVDLAEVVPAETAETVDEPAPDTDQEDHAMAESQATSVLELDGEPADAPAEIATEAETEIQEQVETQAAADVVAEDEPTALEVPTQDEPTHEVKADVQTELAEPEAAPVEPEPEPEPEPVQPGIAPEEVAQREADHFAQGMKQGLAQGMALGEQQARQALADDVAAQCALLAQVTQGLQTLMADSTQFFEPLKRLSLHLAEQLVLGELRMSSVAIERLVQHCLDEVSHPLQEGVVVELNPEDKKILQAQGGEFLQGLRLEASPELQPGSVRVFANDMVVEDLIEHRLQALAKNLLLDVPSWEKQSVLVQPAPSTDHTEHDDDLA